MVGAPTSFGIRPQRACCGPACRWRSSRLCCATGRRTPRRSTPRSISQCCRKSRSPGWERPHDHERSCRTLCGVQAASRSQVRQGERMLRAYADHAMARGERFADVSTMIAWVPGSRTVPRSRSVAPSTRAGCPSQKDGPASRACRAHLGGSSQAHRGPVPGYLNAPLAGTVPFEQMRAVALSQHRRIASCNRARARAGRGLGEA